MELCEGTNLQQIVKERNTGLNKKQNLDYKNVNMPIDQKSGIYRDENHRIASHLLKGIKAMKEKNYEHRDLNPSNICRVMENGQYTYKIGDFKTAKHEQSADPDDE